MTWTVKTGTRGSRCLCEHDGRALYIDARESYSNPEASYIEVVSGGQVLQRQTADNDVAPTVIVALMRQFA